MIGKPDYVYVASSWRCEMHLGVCAALYAAGIDHYNFRDPPERSGFGWEQVMPYDGGLVKEDDYLQALEHPIAVAGYEADFAALARADAVVLVLPCNRSAHLELGWAIGQGKRTAILLDGPLVTPELMYKMVDYISPNLFDLLGWLGVED
jgi:hypothetical protein